VFNGVNAATALLYSSFRSLFSETSASSASVVDIICPSSSFFAFAYSTAFIFHSL
jgi:hypothetical protein